MPARRRKVASPQDVKRLETQNGLDAQAEYKSALADMIQVKALQDANLLTDDQLATIYGDYFDGPESVFGQLHAIDPGRFPVPPRP